ncbi:tetratricopeptide repeat protein [Kitasatospora sp. NBC_01287]|uniref:tetratricopeptide repeat protein n=1 Tax=Kitasatospora sp. NBC_01287 TaxID=2903573 RepID=UPI0022515C2F|nr:tetratricopeptide repeat protein [Kitasatospora sp. NBC_01287]MCX4750402.1 tetratricopeptide repeat protein [Kitasatospora sp. NBC_01287]
MSGWPRWSLEGEPAALAKYVLPEEVAALVRLPGPATGSRLDQARAVYDALAGVGITYSHEGRSDEPGRQVIREPGEILWSPRHATCLDLALTLAAACLHAGLHPLVVIVDAPDSGRAGHALLGLWIEDPDPDGPPLPDADVWTTRPDGWEELVQQDLTGAPRPLLLLDPVGLAHPLPTSPALGTRATFADAARTGARYADTWAWRLAVDLGRAWRRQDTHPTARRPEDSPLRPPYVALDPRVHRPLQLLRAEHAAVRFQARDELTILTDWCLSTAEGPYTGVAVIHGVGGAGKTRLALELAHRLATDHGWYTGCLRENADGRAWLGAVTSPTLIVLDYADARAADARDLLAVLKRRTQRGATPAVLVLTARSTDGQWLTTLRKGWERDGHPCRERPPLRLPPEHPDGAALFRRALRTFQHDPDLADPESFHAAAPQEWTTLDHLLLAFHLSSGPDRVPTTREELYEEVLGHERDYWAQTYRKTTGTTADAPRHVLDRAVACLTLRAPTTRPQTLNALRAVAELADDARWRETIHATLTSCLQPGPGEPLTLRPDPIADHLVLNELRDDPELLARTLDGLDPEQLSAALRQLNRAAAADPDAAGDLFAAWTGGGPERWQPVLLIAAEQGGSALVALQRLVDSEPAPPWLDDLALAIPFTAIGLPQLGLRADGRRLALLRSGGSPAPAELTGLLRRLSRRQADAGDRRGALASITEAVDLYRELVGTEPAVFRPELATALNSLAVRQSETGDRRGALVSVTEAVEIHRALGGAFRSELAAALNNLANRQSETGDRRGALVSVTEAVEIHRALGGAFRSELAAALNNLAIQQGDTGDRRGALVSVTEAVGLYRELVVANPVAFLPNLAVGLNNLSNWQGDTGDRRGALVSVTEAVGLYRELVVANPVAFLPNLAVGLNNLSNWQGDTGDRRGALVSVTEAVGLYRELVVANPVAFLPNLAVGLNNLSNCQGETGDRRGALASITEAVGLYRELVAVDRAAFLPDLAGALNNLSIRQGETGDRRGALESVTESVDLYRELVAVDRAAFLPDLAGALNSLASCRSDTGDRRGALASVSESVDLYREFVADSAAFPDLAGALNNLSIRQGDTGDRRGALASVTEAVGLYRGLVAVDRAAFLPDLAVGLNNLSIRQGETGDRLGALASVTESVDLYREFVADSAAFLPELAGALNNLSNWQGDVGDRRGALASVTEAVDIRRGLAAADPAAFLPDLAGALISLSNRQGETGDRLGALASITRTVDLYRDLVAADRAAFLPELAGALSNLSIRQGEMGNPQAALASITDSVYLYRELVAVDSAAFLPELAGALNNLANRQGEAGDRQAALASVTEAVDIRRDLVATDPAAFLPNLAMSLNNLANAQNDTGNPQAALASITEAVDIRRTLAAADPAAFLPSLALSLNNLAIWQSDTAAATAAWEDAVAAVENHPLAQAELRAHFAAHLAERVGTSAAVDQLLHAAQAAAAGDPQPLQRARQLIRRTATGLDLHDPRLPDWATHALPDSSLKLLDQWNRTADWRSGEAFLRAHAAEILRPDFRHHLRLLVSLFPDDPAVDSLAHALTEADTHGLDPILDRERRNHEAHTLLAAWITTPTWPDSLEFLDEHIEELLTHEVLSLLAGQDTPVGRQHLAILQLAAQLPHDQVFEIVTDLDTATEYGFRAVQLGDVPLLCAVADACPQLVENIAGVLFAAVIATAAGNTDQACQFALIIAEHGTDIQRQAYAIRLRALAELAPDLAGASDLADLIHRDEQL